MGDAPASDRLEHTAPIMNITVQPTQKPRTLVSSPSHPLSQTFCRLPSLPCGSRYSNHRPPNLAAQQKRRRPHQLHPRHAINLRQKQTQSPTQQPLQLLRSTQLCIRGTKCNSFEDQNKKHRSEATPFHVFKTNRNRGCEHTRVHVPDRTFCDHATPGGAMQQQRPM